MDKGYLLHKVEQCSKSLQILRETLERRFSPDDVVDSRLTDLELELTLLKREIAKEK